MRLLHAVSHSACICAAISGHVENFSDFKAETSLPEYSTCSKRYANCFCGDLSKGTFSCTSTTFLLCVSIFCRGETFHRCETCHAIRGTNSWKRGPCIVQLSSWRHALAGRNPADAGVASPPLFWVDPPGTFSKYNLKRLHNSRQFHGSCSPRRT